MILHLIRCIILLALVALHFTSALASDEYPIRRFTDANGKQTGYFITRERLAATPEWIFDGKTLPPLPLADAYRIASQWIAKKYPTMDSFRVRSYAVEQAGNSGAPNRWYYTFDFVGVMNGAEVYGGPFTAMVLMDGTIIEPREIKPGEA
jgi:hypothetical protein